MRVLFAAPGAAGHLFPLIPTAQALRSAGHDVLLAGRQPVDILRATGLPVVEVGDGSTLRDAFQSAAARVAAQPDYVSGSRTEEETMRLASLGFAEHGQRALDSLHGLAEVWRPDLLVHAAFDAAAPLVAASLGIPAVVHNFGVMSGLSMADRLAAVLAEDYRARGLSGPGARTVLDVVPTSLGGDGTGWRVRYVPYNGGGTVPAELAARGPRRRVAVTLGTVLTDWDGVRAIARVIEQAAGIDADFLLAVGDADLAPLGTLPANVRPLPWVPLAQLLESADAVVHHGGSGTMLTAAAVGIPQLILPQGADHFTNADAAEGLGFALRAEDTAVDTELLDALLGDDRLRKGAAAVRAAMNALPTPAELVPRLEEFVRTS
ncbi:salmochelin biosynthesis C-glycosyltransferase IroB [Kitasatospora atroaurantiaca]|uniref:UDP:flavonoid glycosyltransferase YjiC (YdhE family) n=1 Tax=Kitasatospora atroaurantiaca TaxID=285545 RepID=A0A561EZN2_9ACTN|nr:nucleotide disphospho-sugar-binding domain-containing protein [Kitasatospora atroaurantiaca]TWE21053.1 UDP:flavonoid glycosyltransferase YjiC (YdhE family) [Kitasatospora atroaurantiaca]